MQNKYSRSALLAFLIVGATVVLPSTGFAYIGPGAGLSAIGALLALIAAIVVAIIGFVWFPVKRMLRQRRKAAAQSRDASSQDSPTP